MARDGFLSSGAQRIFLGTIVVQAAVVFTMVALAFGLVERKVDTSDIRYRTLPCYLALFGLGGLFELFICFDALRLRNVMQLIMILEFHASLIIFSALQIHQTRTSLVINPGEVCYATCDSPGSLWKTVEKFLIVVPCALTAALVIMVLTVRALYAEFGWAVFHAIGADPAKRTMYRYYQICLCLLKFDFFCFVGITMQLLILVLSRDSVEFGLTIAAIPIVLTLLIGCGIALQHEIKWLMTTSLVLMLAAQSYFVYKFVRLFLPSSRGRYITTRTTLAFFLIVSSLLLLGTFAVGIKCYRDFDKGLRQPKVAEGMTKPKLPNGSTPMGERNGSYMGGAPLGQRMSIE